MLHSFSGDDAAAWLKRKQGVHPFVDSKADGLVFQGQLSGIGGFSCGSGTVDEMGDGMDGHRSLFD